MSSYEKRIEALARTNPLFGSAKLKLGTFCTNVSGGATMSSMEGVYQLSWPNAKHLASLADQMNFEAIVPIARWRGFGGDTDFNGEVLESLTFAAGVAATVAGPAPFATIHVPSLHPVMAAKQVATVDHISEGRFALNIVTGWNDNEIALFGSALMPHDERYDAADEWITVMKQMWTSDEPVNFEGKYYQVKDAYLRPKPIQPYPALMSAGSSPRGRAFAAKHCDVAFALLAERDVDSIRNRLRSFRDIAEQEHGRKIQIWINAYMIIGDSDADAQRQYDHCVLENGDFAGVENLLRAFKMNAQSLAPEMAEKLKQEFIAGWSGYRLMGTKERIVEDMAMLAEAGVDGILLAWPAFIKGMERFQSEIHPLLVQAGLR